MHEFYIHDYFTCDYGLKFVSWLLIKKMEKYL